MGLARPAGFSLGGDIACIQNFQKSLISEQKDNDLLYKLGKSPFCSLVTCNSMH